MGWKAIKDHYDIRHIVCVTDAGICIGSGYIHDIIVIASDGSISMRYDDRSNDELRRYQAEMDADPAQLRGLVQASDTFAQSLIVYTFEEGQVIEKRCDALGWPNVTHDGCLMYENKFSGDKGEAVRWATRDVELAIKFTRDHINQHDRELALLHTRLAQYESNLQALVASYPEAAEAAETAQEPSHPADDRPAT